MSLNILLALLVLQIVFNIQQTLSLHRQKQYTQPHTPFQSSVPQHGERDFFIF